MWAKGKDFPRDLFSGKVIVIRVVKHDNIGHLKVFPDSKDQLGQVQHQRHQGVCQEHGIPNILIFCKFVRINIVKHDDIGHPKVFADSLDHLGYI